MGCLMELAENMSGLEKPNSERVIEVANNTNIHEMILRLPQGYETYINSRDVFLSVEKFRELVRLVQYVIIQNVLY